MTTDPRRPAPSLRLTRKQRQGVLALGEPDESDVTPEQKRRQERGRIRAVRHRAKISAFPGFVLAVANAVWNERRLGRLPSEAIVRRLAASHPALVADLRRWRVPHARSSSPLTAVPFLLAGFYFARLLAMLARPPHRRTAAFVACADAGRDTIEGRWGSVAFAMTLFDRPEDRGAWYENCAAAATWLERFLYSPDARSSALIRCCERRRCPRPLFLYRGGQPPRRCPRCRARSQRGQNTPR
jgi:hypothetical protein